jgi:hypothetical protein
MTKKSTGRASVALPIADFQLAILTLPGPLLHELLLIPSVGWLFMMLMPFGMP